MNLLQTSGTFLGHIMLLLCKLLNGVKSFGIIHCECLMLLLKYLYAYIQRRAKSERYNSFLRSSKNMDSVTCQYLHLWTLTFTSFFDGWPKSQRHLKLQETLTLPQHLFRLPPLFLPQNLNLFRPNHHHYSIFSLSLCAGK